jgi:hypothetical protein
MINKSFFNKISNFLKTFTKEQETFQTVGQKNKNVININNQDKEKSEVLGSKEENKFVIILLLIYLKQLFF